MFIDFLADPITTGEVAKVGLPFGSKGGKVRNRRVSPVAPRVPAKVP